jgi:hypothetical protein
MFQPQQSGALSRMTTRCPILATWLGEFLIGCLISPEPMPWEALRFVTRGATALLDSGHVQTSRVPSQCLAFLRAPNWKILEAWNAT